MTMDRRLVLKSLLVTAGISMSPLTWAQASRNSMKRGNVFVTPLVCTSRMQAEFLTSVQIEAANRGWSMKQAMHLQTLDGATYQSINDLVHIPSPVVLVGLLDDAWTTLLHDLVRAEGGQMLPSQSHDFCCTFNMEET